MILPILMASLSGCAGRGGAAVDLALPTLTLCELVARASEYAGKSVLISATLLSNFSSETFVDYRCSPARPPRDGILATIDEAHLAHADRAVQRRLRVLLRDGGTAKVVAIARFVDPGRHVGHLDCCRYLLEVQHLIAVGLPQ